MCTSTSGWSQNEGCGGSAGLVEGGLREDALERGAYALLLAVALTWVATLAWDLRRLDRAAALPPAESRRYALDASPFVTDR